MTEGEDWLDRVRASLLRDYRLGNIVPPPMPTPSLGPLDLIGPKPTRLNQGPAYKKYAQVHQPRTDIFPVPQSPMPQAIPQGSPRPAQGDMPEVLPPMPPVTPYAPPMPARNPMRQEQPQLEPRGGFGSTGDMSGSELERRLKPTPTEDRWFLPPTQITNLPERSPLDKAIEQAVFTIAGLLPAGRGIKALQAARVAGPSIVPKVARGARSLTDELQAIHRAAPKYRAPRPKKDWALTGDQLARKKAYYNSPTYQNKRLISQLGTKGKLDARTGRLIDEADAPVSQSHWWIR